ncbi:MAG TPA: serine/threonine-protein kinase, partial [Polyangiaceae bacterium]|nr:serine/threonine-protein kinase [Polyangiaceae bacterium]
MIDQIGRGGMARIYLGRAETDLGGERLLVIKRILPILSDNTEFSRLLVDEAKLAARLSHGNIVQVLDLGRHDGELYIAMEYVEGFDLRELLRRCAKEQIGLPLDFSLLIVSEVLRALDYAHKKRDETGQPLGIVHRDVSPSNVLLSFEGEVKICDFGIARAAGVGGELSPEAIRGKAAYMSPEAASGEALDGRSDLFSCGIILWELLSGQRLYRAPEGQAVALETAIRAEIRPLPAGDYPDEERLRSIVNQALARQPAQRHASAREMLKELDGYVTQNKLAASPLRLGEWLTRHFATDIVDLRREREVLAKQLASAELGPYASSYLHAELPGPPSLQAPALDIPRLSPLPPSL